MEEALEEDVSVCLEELKLQVFYFMSLFFEVSPRGRVWCVSRSSGWLQFFFFGVGGARGGRVVRVCVLRCVRLVV